MVWQVRVEGGKRCVGEGTEDVSVFRLGFGRITDSNCRLPLWDPMGALA